MNIDRNKIKSELEELQNKGKQLNLLFLIPTIYLIVGFVIFALLRMPEWTAKAHIVISTVIFAFAAGKKNEYYDKYRDTHKQLIVQRVLEAYFENPVYEPWRGFASDDVKAMHLFKWKGNYDYDAEDLLEAKYKGVHFKMADIQLSYKDNDDHRFYDISGRLYQIDFPRDINGTVLVRTNAIINAGVEKGLEEVKMEDVDFNKKFKVFSDDEHSVFYLLTPQFMETIKKLHDRAKHVFIGFDGEHINIICSGIVGAFEPADSKQVDIDKEIDKIEGQLDYFTDIMERLGIV